MENQDIRWKQRFANFEKAYFQLEKATYQAINASDLEKEGTIQRFEFTHELAWKLMKDFLNFKGITGIIGSKDAVRIAFQNELIEDASHWMDMIESRNLTVHTYHQDILDKEFHKIINWYFPTIKIFYNKMKSLL